MGIDPNAIQWDSPAPAAPSTPATSYPGVIHGRPKAAPQPTPVNPHTVITDQRDYNADRGDTAYKNETDLRKEFSNADIVTEFGKMRTSWGKIDALSKRGDKATAQDDMALIFSFMKMLDPGSVVREGEYATAQNAAGIPDQVRNYYNRTISGERLAPTQREEMRQSAARVYLPVRDQYNERARRYRGLAEGGGFTPDNVALEYIQTNTGQANTQQNGSAKGVEMRGAVPIGSKVEFGMDGGDNAPFDRDAALRARGIPGADGEATITAFWNNNRLNENFTADAAKRWYEAQGFPAPPPAELQQMVDYAKEGQKFGGVDLQAEEAAYRDQLQGRLDKQGFDPNSIGSAAGMAVQGRAFGLLDEAEGFTSAVDALSRGDINNVIPEYQRGRDAARLAVEQTQQAWPNAAPAAEFIGGMFGGGSAFKGADSAMGLAKAGGKVGALTGFGYGEGLQGSTQNALMGAGGGAILAPVVGAGTNALAKFSAPQLERLSGRATQAAPDMNVVAAGERQGIPIRQPDAIPELRGKYGEVESSPAGGPKIRNAAAQDVAAIENRVAQIGGQGTPAKEAYDTGKAAQKVVERHGKNTKDEAKARYTRAEQLSGDPSVVPENAISKFDEAISTLSANPKMNAKEIAFLKGIRSDLAAKGGKTISQLREIRSNLRTSIKANGLDNTPAEARAQELLKQTSADIERALADNPEALAQYKKGDQIWAKRADFREQVTRELIGRDGKKSAQETAAALRSMMKNDSDNFSRFLNELTDEEGADLAATLASNLGRNNKGEFSLPIFLTNLDPKNGLVSPRVMKDVFGPDAMKALADLRTIAQAKIGTATERNTSRTTSTGEGKMRGLRTALFSLIGLSTGGVSGAVIAPMAENFIAKMGQERAARMLLNPNFTKWLKDAPEATNPKAIDRYVAKLGTLNLAANDNTAFVNAVKEVLTQSPGRVAASTEQENDGRREPPQQ